MQNTSTRRTKPKLLRGIGAVFRDRYMRQPIKTVRANLLVRYMTCEEELNYLTFY